MEIGGPTMKRVGCIGLAAGLVVSAMVSFGWAQEKPASGAQRALDDCIPGDAMLYVHYQGLAKAQSGFQRTALSEILAEPEVQEFGKELSRFLDELIRKNAPQSPLSWQDVRMLLDLEMGYALLDVRGQPPSIMLVVRPAANADKLRAVVDKLIAGVVPPGQAIPENEIEGVLFKQVGPLSVAWQGDDLVLTTGRGTLLKVVRVLKGTDLSMAKSDRFKAVCSKTLGGKEFLMAHWDVEKTRRILDEMRQGDAEAARVWAVTGLKDVDHLHLSIAPDAPGMKMMFYAHAPAGAHGLLKLFPTKPVDEKAMLANMPETASDFLIARCGAADVFDAIAEMLSPTEDKARFNESVARFNQRVGFDLRKGLLASLGDEVTFRTMGSGVLWLPEFYLSVGVKDEKTLRDCLDKILAVAAEEMGNAGDRRVTLETEKLDYKGVSIVACKFVGMPLPFTPSYATVKGRMFLALTPQGLKRALDLETAPARSILGSNTYAALRSHVSAKPGMLGYGEFKGSFEQVYSGLVTTLVQMTSGIPNLPPHSLATKFPSANAITPHLFGTVTAVSYDGEGYLMESYGPFGGGLVPGSADSLTTTGIMAGFLLPALAKAQEAARRASCMNNIRQIGIAMIQYSADHDDEFPPSFGVLLKVGYLITPKVFYCPSSPAKVPADFPEDLKGAEVADMDKLLDASASYVMVKGIKHTADAGFIVLYEKEGAHNREGMNCFFNDGRVQWLMEADFQERMKAQGAELPPMLAPMPEKAVE